MFWAFIVISSLLVAIFFSFKHLAIVLISLLVSTISVFFSTRVLIGHVAFTNAFKAVVISIIAAAFTLFLLSGSVMNWGWPAIVLTFLLPFIAVLHVYSRYLSTSYPYAFCILIVSGLINWLCFFPFDVISYP